MIIRDIVDNPHKPFDFFNDFKDTMRWLEQTPNKSQRVVEAIEILKTREREYEVSRTRSIPFRHYWAYSDESFDEVPPRIPRKYALVRKIKKCAREGNLLELSLVEKDGSYDPSYTIIRDENQVWRSEDAVNDDFFQKTKEYIERAKEEIEDFEAQVEQLKKQKENEKNSKSEFYKDLFAEYDISDPELMSVFVPFVEGEVDLTDKYAKILDENKNLQSFVEEALAHKFAPFQKIANHE